MIENLIFRSECKIESLKHKLFCEFKERHKFFGTGISEALAVFRHYKRQLREEELQLEILVKYRNENIH